MSGRLKDDARERKLRVTLLSTEWKASSNGDLTTINRELAIQMAKHPNVEVSVFLPQCSEEDKRDAESYNAKLVEPGKLPGLKPVFWLACVPDGHAMDCVVGHGVALGQQIPLIKNNPNYTHCKWIQVVHTAPEEIGMYKSISEGQQMQETEIKLCEMADQVITIGPKLTDAYRYQLRNQDVFNLTPSILTEFLDVQQASDERRTFCVLVIESGDSEDFYVKGYDIAVKAIANLKDKSYQLKFASKQRGKEDELADKLLQCGIGCGQLIICSFDENRETLANLFSVVDIAILPSKTEGFGLSALEAISAGLPVLVSGNSGIAEALREVPNGSQCIVDSEDPAEWARAIKAVHDKKRKVRLAEAKFLRGNYLQQFSWEEPCNFLVKKMYSLAFGVELNVKVDVDDLKPEEQNMQTGMLAIESVRCQKVQQPKASATSAASGGVSDPQIEDLKALKEKTFLSIITNSFHSTKPQSIEEWNWFKEFAKEMRVTIIGVSEGSLVITVRCESLMILEELWTDYLSGRLDDVVQNCFVTEKILKELNLAELRLKTTMDKEEYNACKMFFEKDALRGALSSEFHSTSSTSESPPKKEQWEKSEQKTKIVETVKLEGASSSEFHSISLTGESQQNQEELKKWKQETKIVETEKQKGMLPPLGSSTSDPEEELEELRMKLQIMKDLKEKLERVCVDLKMLRTEGSFPVLKVSIVDLEEKLTELRWKLPGSRMEAYSSGCFPVLQCSTIDLEKKLDELCMQFQRLRMEGTLPPPQLFTTDPGEDFERHLIELDRVLMKDLKEKLERVCVDLKMLRTEGSFPVLKVSIVDLEEKLTELRWKLPGSRMEAYSSGCFPVLQCSTVDLAKKLDELCMEFQRLRMEGTLPPPQLFTTDPGDDFERHLIELGRVLMKGSSYPLLLSTTDLEEKLERVCVDLKMLRTEGSFPVLKVSTIDLEEKLTDLHMKLQRSRMEGTFLSPALLTANLEEKLIELLTELERQRDKGSLPPAFSTVEVEVDELLKKFQKWRIEDGLSSEFHSTSSTSESPQKKEQWEKSEQKTKIVETVKLEGTSPLIVVPTSGHGKELEESWGRKGMLPLPGSSTFDLEGELEELCKKLLIMEGSLHSLPTTDLKEKLKQVFEEISKLRMRGSFSALKFSTIGLEKKLAELRMELERLRMEGTLPHPELFTADLEDDQEQLEQLIWILIRRKRVKGSLRSLFLTIETVSSLRRELEKVKMAALLNAMYPTIRSGLAKFDVSLPEELQNYVSYLLDVSAKLHLRKQELQPPRALEELREAMDKGELKTFLTIHIREGAWQVVLLFMDELPKVKLPWDRCGKIHNEDEDEDEDEDEEVSNEVIYSSKTGILNEWPTHYDPGLVTLCKAITNKDWKVTRLILSLSRIPDEGLKNLSTALTQSELYSLTLYDIGLQSQGLEHLCNALTSVNCRLTNLNVRCNKLGDVGIMHLCNALTSVNCRLTNLNVSLNKLGDVGIMHLCNALTSVDCTLTSLNVSDSELGDVGIRLLCNALASVNCRLTSLNVSNNQLGDNGLKHLCDALTSSNCALTKLKVGFNRLGDGGMKELSEVLTNGFCTLTSLDIRGNKFGDGGVKHLCKALTDTKCKLRSLNLRANSYVTDDGKKYLSQMLIGSDWEDEGALRLYRSTTK